MENISIEMTPEEANEIRAALEYATEVMRQANERMDEREKEFEANHREMREIIARIAAINFHNVRDNDLEKEIRRERKLMLLQLENRVLRAKL